MYGMKTLGYWYFFDEVTVNALHMNVVKEGMKPYWSLKVNTLKLSLNVIASNQITNHKSF